MSRTDVAGPTSPAVNPCTSAEERIVTPSVATSRSAPGRSGAVLVRDPGSIAGPRVKPEAFLAGPVEGSARLGDSEEERPTVPRRYPQAGTAPSLPVAADD